MCAEESLRKLSRAVEQSSVSIVITNTAGDIEYVNPKFTAITGYSQAEVQGKNPRVLKSGDAPPEEYARLWQTITAGKEWRGEFHNRKEERRVILGIRLHFAGLRRPGCDHSLRGREGGHH
jgi:PAS domain S-box-containing protein